MSRVSPAIRSQVRNRASGRCEYCHKPEQYSLSRYHVDHIIPVKRHHGSKGLNNLAWACLSCNISKGSDIASYDLITGALTPLYNPRTQKWDEHFEMDGLEIRGKTPAGRVTVHILQMNDSEQIGTRRYLMSAGLW